MVEAQRSWRTPGLSVGVVLGGQLVWSHHVGAARLDPVTPADDDTQFMIGSITKTFTAVLIMQLRDAGRLSLAAARPAWETAQAAFEAAFGAGEAVALRATLGRVARLEFPGEAAA